MIKYKIDVKKINKAHLYEGSKGTYLNGVFFENKNGPSEYGDDGFIVQDISKAARDAGEKGPIIGNWRRMEPKAAAPKSETPKLTDEAEDDGSIPF
jgi:hypothetical protein